MHHHQRLFNEFWKFYRKNKRLFYAYGLYGSFAKNYKWNMHGTTFYYKDIKINLRFFNGKYYDMTQEEGSDYVIFDIMKNKSLVSEIAVHKDDWIILPQLISRIALGFLYTEFDCLYIQDLPYITDEIPEYRDGWVYYRGIKVRLARGNFRNHPTYWYIHTPILRMESTENVPIWRGRFLE